jgi:hypothetical protein
MELHPMTDLPGPEIESRSREALIEKVAEAIRHWLYDTDANIEGAARAALATIEAEQQEQFAALLDGIRSAERHTDELEEAWRAGNITEHDGKGGTRSNRNVALNRHLRSLLEPFERTFGSTRKESPKIEGGSQ